MNEDHNFAGEVESSEYRSLLLSIGLSILHIRGLSSPIPLDLFVLIII